MDSEKREMQMDKKELFEHVEALHTTEIGVLRIKRNLKLTDQDVVEFCKEIMLNDQSMIYRNGKNWYCENGKVRITINAGSYTIITAHLMK